MLATTGFQSPLHWSVVLHSLIWQCGKICHLLSGFMQEKRQAPNSLVSQGLHLLGLSFDSCHLIVTIPTIRIWPSDIYLLHEGAHVNNYVPLKSHRMCTCLPGRTLFLQELYSCWRTFSQFRSNHWASNVEKKLTYYLRSSCMSCYLIFCSWNWGFWYSKIASIWIPKPKQYVNPEICTEKILVWNLKNNQQWHTILLQN